MNLVAALLGASTALVVVGAITFISMDEEGSMDNSENVPGDSKDSEESSNEGDFREHVERMSG